MYVCPRALYLTTHCTRERARTHTHIIMYKVVTINENKFKQQQHNNKKISF